MQTEYRPSSSHWGAFRVRRGEGGLEVLPRAGDPDPSPLLGNIAGAHRHPSRVARPAVRRGWLERGPASRAERGAEPFVEVSWPVALDLVAEELRRVRAEHGDPAIFGGSYGWGSAGRFHNPAAQLHRFLALGGGFTGSTGTYSTGAAAVALPHIVGAKGARELLDQGTDWPVIAAHTDLLVAFGGIRTANLGVSYGGRAAHAVRDRLREATARGMRVASVSPIRDDLPPELTGDWLPLTPGTDVAVMFALAFVLITEGHADTGFLDRCTVGGDRFVASVLGSHDGVPKSPDWAAGITGISAAAIRSLARRMAAGRTMITVSWSLQRARHGEQPLWAGLALAALLGQIGLPGSGFGLGYGSMGYVGGGSLPYGLPSVPMVPNPVASSIPCARVADLLLHPGTAYQFNGQTRTYPDIRLVYWAGGNPFHHHQDLTRLTAAFRRPDTVIVHEPYWTATARHADIVLPATTAWEREDIGAGKGDTHLIAMHRADEPYAGARDEYDILADLAGRLGYRDRFTEGRDARAWLERCYERWRHRPGLPPFAEFWAAGEAELPGRREDTVSFRDFRQGAALGTPSGRIELYSETVAGFGYDDCPGEPTWFPPERDDTHPLHLIANQPAARLHSQLDMGAHSAATKVGGREPVRLHPADAAAREIADGDVVLLTSASGSVLAGAVLSEELMPGVVQLSTGAWFDPSAPGVATCVHGNPNALTTDVGTSRLAQACTGQVARVQVAKHQGPLPPVRALSAPPLVPPDDLDLDLDKE